MLIENVRALWKALSSPVRLGRRRFTDSQLWGLPWFGDALDPRLPTKRQAQAEEGLVRAREKLPPKRGEAPSRRGVSNP